MEQSIRDRQLWFAKWPLEPALALVIRYRSKTLDIRPAVAILQQEAEAVRAGLKDP